jgi:oligosaccharide repeat unit polymerase
MISLEIFVPLLLLGLLAAIARMTLGSWLAPGAFFPLFWVGLMAISLPVQEYPLWPPALWWIVGTLLVFYLGTLLGGGRRTTAKTNPSLTSERSIRLPGLGGLVLFCCGLGIVYILTRELVAPQILDSPPPWFQFLLSAMYAGPLLGGMLFASNSKGRSRVVALAPLATTFVYAVAYLGRSPMLVGLYFWCSGFWAMRIWKTGGAVPLFTKRMVIALPLLLVALAIAGATIGALRKNTTTLTLEERVEVYADVLESADASKEWTGFRHGMLSHPYAFSHYLRRAIDRPPNPAFGLKMFAGPTQLLGIKQRTPFEQFEVDSGVMSNVYSLFMPPIEDFGLAGSFFAFLVAGVIAGWAFGRVARGTVSLIALLNMFYPHVLVVGGYFFAYNSITLAYVMVGGYLLYVHRRSERWRVALAQPRHLANRQFAGEVSEGSHLQTVGGLSPLRGAARASVGGLMRSR